MTIYQPTHRAARRGGLKTVLAVGIPAVVLIGVGVGLIVPRLTGSASGDGSFLPGLGGGGSKDPGIAACEGMRDAPKALASLAPDPSNLDPDKINEALKKVPDVFRELRARFEGSRYPAIRESGTRFAEASLQVFTPRAQDDYEGTLTAIAKQGQAYKDLSGACAEQGIMIPQSFGSLDG